MEWDVPLRVDGRMFTRDRGDGKPVYGENMMEHDGSIYREWIPWRSKLGALFKKREDVPGLHGNILYLGAAQGTTVSHISDLLDDGMIYAVEFSPVAFRKLAMISKNRKNIVPILADAFHPERYQAMVPPVDILYQDVSQKDQVGMFMKNAFIFLKKGGSGFLMLKARSVDVTARPEDIFDIATKELKKEGFEVEAVEDLSPFQIDHAAILVTLP